MRKIDLSNIQVATSETARDINRRVVLNLIRTHQPISRADLARYSGLQRSTVSAITEHLIEERWVTEGAIGQLPRGRKPRFLHLNVERAGIIGVNVRPQLTTIALAGLDARFVAQESMPTLDDPAKFVKELSGRLRDLIKAHPQISYEGIGVSLPGRVELTSQRLFFSPNLGWSNVDLKTPLENATGLPVDLENAANACALAELWFGENESVRDLIAVTVSEGIGVGMLLNGQLVRGADGLAGEFGHIAVSESDILCNCGKRGCWEMLASNRAAVRYYAQAVSHSRNGKAGAKAAAPLPSFDDVLRLAEQSDAKAVEALELMAHHLGVGIAMLATGLAPEAIVIVGEVTRAWKRVGPIIDEVIKARALPLATTRILPTDPSAQPRLRGAIALVLQKHFGAPSGA